MIINSNSERDYVATYSCRASSGSANSIIGLYKSSVSLTRLAIISRVNLWVRKRCKLLKVLTIHSTVTPGVAGSSPVRSAILSPVSVHWLLAYAKPRQESAVSHDKRSRVA